MMKALYSGVAGLKSHQTKMDVVGNNISNVNTYAYKTQRATIKDSFYQTLQSAYDASNTSGGGNATQVGYGSQLGTIDVINTRGSYVSTGRSMDVFIQGDGYLIAKDANGQELYTRVGILGFDGAGGLVDGNNNRIYGYPMARYAQDVDAVAGSVNLGGDLNVDFGTVNDNFFNDYKIKTVSAAGADTSAKIDLDQKTITITGDGDLSAADIQTALNNMTAVSGTIPGRIDLNDITVTGADTLTAGSAVAGNVSGGDKSHRSGELIFQTVPATAAVLTVNNMKIDFGSNNGEYFNGFKIKTVFDSSASGTTASADLANKLITITSSSSNISSDDVKTALNNMAPLGGTGEFPNGTDLSLITVDDSAATTLATGITSSSALGGADAVCTTLLDKSNGLQQIQKCGTLIDTDNDGVYDTEAGNVMALSGISIAENGLITGEDTNGNIIQIGQIMLADISNPQALNLDGNNYAVADGNTGEINYYTPGEGSVGTLVSSGLENSNVDLATQFSDMIITQRGFQANSRIITVGDEMLEELVNLKR